MSDRKFDRHGNEYRVAELRDGQRLVWSQFDDSLQFVAESELYDEPPRGKVDAEIASRRVILKELNLAIRARRDALNAFKEDSEAVKTRLKQHEALKHLDALLSGGITHYVSQHYDWQPPKITAIADARCEYNRDGLKLLTLFGNSKGNLSFGLNKYCDGAGSNATVIPCVARVDAIVLVHKIFATHVQNALDPEHKAKPAREWLAAAEDWNIVLDDKYALAIEEREALEKRKQITDLKAKLRTLEAESTT